MPDHSEDSGGLRLFLETGAVVVFEGLDKAGKSTQLDCLKGSVERDSAKFAHMPSGDSPFTQRMYRTLESVWERPQSGLAQQLSHLACHAETMSDLVRAREDNALVLDRWWWSTLAYGWYGGPIASAGLTLRAFQELIDAIWAPIQASVVFVFLEPHQEDANNNAAIVDGYRRLASEHAELAIETPQMSVDDVHEFIVQSLVDRGLARQGSAGLGG